MVNAMVIMVVSADGAGKRGRGMVTTGYGAGTLGKYGGGGGGSWQVWDGNGGEFT